MPNCSIVTFKVCVCLLIFCLVDLPIGVSGILTSPTLNVLLLISPFILVSICLTYCSVPMCIYICNCRILFLDGYFDHYIVSFFVSFHSLCLKSILSDTSIATPAFPWSLFAWNIFFQPFTFSLYVSPVLRWVSCRQHI